MKVCGRCSEVHEDPLDRCPVDGELLVSASDPLVGRTVGGRYRLISRIGIGGMSSVYLARHVLVDRLVAVKNLRSDLAEDPKQRDRFIREARAVNRINHDNIVEITDFGETEDGLVYLVMEYVPGEPLFKAMARGPYSAMRALHVAEQIAGALGRAHQMGVIHRDLKPENLLVVPQKGRPDFIKILDFGIAKILDAPSLTGSQQIFGTPGYIAPEYIQSTNIDGRADLYSLGVILYELVTGALPFDYEYPGDLLVKHVTEAPIPPRKRRAEVEAPIEELILRCLEKNPDRRFRDAYHFLEELRATRERLGGDELGGLGDGSPYLGDESGAGVPTPVMKPGSQDDLLRRAVENRPTPHEQPVVAPNPLAAPRPNGTMRNEMTPEAGLAASKRWRRRFDAMRVALDDIELVDPAPAQIAQHMAFCSQRVDELEQEVEVASRSHGELEDVEARGRAYRASLGATIDELAMQLNALNGQYDELRAQHEDATGDVDGARFADELRIREQRRASVEAQLAELRGQLEDQSAGLEARIGSLVMACHEQMIRLDTLASSLRGPLEAVERFIRAWWDERSAESPPRR
jgi:eukaryotic-like serine/threonine-protein kinase